MRGSSRLNIGATRPLTIFVTTQRSDLTGLRKGPWNTVCTAVQTAVLAFGVMIASRGENMGHVLRALARSPLVTGLARSVDLLGAFNEPMPYSGRESGAVKDQRAMADDWRALGRDIGGAIDEVVQDSRTAA